MARRLSMRESVVCWEFFEQNRENSSHFVCQAASLCTGPRQSTGNVYFGRLVLVMAVTKRLIELPSLQCGFH